MDNIYAAIALAIVGFILGFALRRVVNRSPIHLSLFGTRSHCPNCGVDVSVMSRACGNCRHSLYPKLPLLELACAGILGLLGARVGWSWTLPAYAVTFVTLVIITAVDLRHYMIPTRVVYPATFLALILFTAAALINGDGGNLVSALIGMVGAWFFFFVVWFIYPAGMGFGDVRLALLIGLASGYVSIGNVVLAVFLSLLIGAAVGVVLIVINLRNRKQAIPFGPFLAAGAMVSILGGGLF